MLRTCAAVAALATAVIVQGPLGALASATGPPPAGSTGHDISWPQCGASYPGDGSFGIVGVSDGRAWSANPCLGSEYQWAATYPRTPDVYMNTANPAPTSNYYWPTSGTRDPALCSDATVTNDPGCAYDYGWHTAANALATATSTLGTNAGYWWLDVETGNTWNGDASSNAADVQGSIDYLLSENVAGVGVYSTAYQWTTITGGYATSNASQYAAAWSSEFTSPNGISHSPSWVAGASGASDAPSHCSSSFLATTTWLVQYISGGFDVDYACDTGAPATADYSIALPLSLSAPAGGSVSATVTVTSTNGWSGTLALSVSKPSQVTATLSSSSIALSANGSATTTLTLRSKKVGTYTVTVTASPSSGSSTTTPHSVSTSFTVTATGRRATAQ